MMYDSPANAEIARRQQELRDMANTPFIGGYPTTTAPIPPTPTPLDTLREAQSIVQKVWAEMTELADILCGDRLSKDSADRVHPTPVVGGVFGEIEITANAIKYLAIQMSADIGRVVGAVRR